jgi:hypothetical protein
MPAAHLDPSMALGFFCRSPSELAALCDGLRAVLQRHGVALFDVHDEDPAVELAASAAAHDMSEVMSDDDVADAVAGAAAHGDVTSPRSDHEGDSDDYVFV